MKGVFVWIIYCHPLLLKFIGPVLFSDVGGKRFGKSQHLKQELIARFVPKAFQLSGCPSIFGEIVMRCQVVGQQCLEFRSRS